jgi:hypothetical protein
VQMMLNLPDALALGNLCTDGERPVLCIHIHIYVYRVYTYIYIEREPIYFHDLHVPSRYIPLYHQTLVSEFYQYYSAIWSISHYISWYPFFIFLYFWRLISLS